MRESDHSKIHEHNPFKVMKCSRPDFLRCDYEMYKDQVMKSDNSWFINDINVERLKIKNEFIQKLTLNCMAVYTYSIHTTFMYYTIYVCPLYIFIIQMIR